MSVQTRGTKSVGGTSFIDGAGNAILASEVNTDLDRLYTLQDGNIDKDNISSSADIPNSSLAKIADTKVDDSSDDATALYVTKTPGDSASITLPTDLKEELQALRYRIGANNGYTSTPQYMATGGSMTTAIPWLEPPTIGRNLFPNPGFEVQSGVADSAPDGWTLVLTPTTVVIENPGDPEAGLEKRSLRILADASSVGIKRIVTGLKPSTKYLVGMAYTLTVGDINIVTTNALGSGDYKNLSFNDTDVTSSGIEIFNGIVKTDSTPTDITVSIISSADLDDFNLYYVWFYEMGEAAPYELPHIPMQTAVYSAADDTQTTTGSGTWAAKTDLSITQYVPYEGYRFTYEVTLCFESDAGGSNASDFAFRIQQNIDAGGATTVEGPLAFHLINIGNAANTVGGIINLKYVIENPVPGSSYEFTVDAYIEGTTSTYDSIVFNPTVLTGLATQSSSRLTTERI